MQPGRTVKDGTGDQGGLEIMIPKYRHDINKIMVDISRIPQSEREATWINISSVNNLIGYVEDFGAVCRLYEFCKSSRYTDRENSDYLKWSLVAGRDGAMSMYHFWMILSGTNFRDCPTLRNFIDFCKLKDARKKFKQAFPDIEKVRHAVAHRAEIRQTLKKTTKNSFSGSISMPGININNVKNFSISDSFIDNKFHCTINGKIITYELSINTLNKLTEITCDYYVGFQDVIKNLSPYNLF